jgi:hypothetical protein
MKRPTSRKRHLPEKVVPEPAVIVVALRGTITKARGRLMATGTAAN